MSSQVFLAVLVAFNFLLILLFFHPPLAASSKKSFRNNGGFSYDMSARNGPLYWSELNMEGNECGGTRNSPIDISLTEQCNLVGGYSFQAGSCTIEDLDPMITPSGPKLVFPKRCLDNTMAIPGYQGKYQLLQIHTHIGSEHRLDGTTSDGEIHLVHKQSNGYYYAVMAILISAVDDDDTAENNTVFESLLNAWEAVEYQTNAACNEGERSRRALTTTEKRKLEGDNHQQQQQQQQQQSLDIYTGLLPQNTNFYQYSGSLTTPPCTEAVFWEVAETSLQISTSQYQRLVALTLSYRDSETCEWSIAASPKTKTTNRPVQDLNGRAVTRICPQQ